MRCVSFTLLFLLFFALSGIHNLSRCFPRNMSKTTRVNFQSGDSDLGNHTMGENKESIHRVTPIAEFVRKKDTSESLRILLTSLERFYQPESYDDEIETKEAVKLESDRCKRYGFVYNESVTHKRRRIFMGSLVADDTWHVIATHAAEAYGLYHTVVLIESNTTQTMTERETRFDKGSLNWRMIHSGIFGAKTNIVIDFRPDAAKDFPGLPPIWRENLQRSYITTRWKDAGMKPNDIGIICDVDEVFTRDFLLALQICDVPNFRTGQDCFRPQVSGQGLTFETGPNCQFQRRRFFHRPNAIIGECIEHIGNETAHTKGMRNTGNWPGSHLIAARIFDRDPNRTFYPLWQPWDFRNSKSDENLVLENGQRHTGYHFHNFFNSFDDFRNKYKTYGHPNDSADKAPIESFGTGHIIVPCLRGQKGMHESFDEIEGRRPLLWDAPYCVARSREIQEEFRRDAKQ